MPAKKFLVNKVWHWIVLPIILVGLVVVVVFAVKHVDDDDFEKYVGLAGVVVTFLGFLLVIKQLHSTRLAAESQTRWQIEQVSFNVYNLLVHKPNLRPYFYDGTAPPADGPARWEVDSACELLLDYFETIVSSRTEHDDPSEQVWCAYMRQVYTGSPVMRAFLRQESHRYRIDLIEELDGNLAKEEKARRQAARPRKYAT